MTAAGPGKPARLGRSARRLLARLAPERRAVAGVVALAVASVALGLPGPWLLGRASNVIFAGFIGARFTSDAAWRAAIDPVHDPRLAGMLRQLAVVPGAGIDFARLAGWLALALALYLASFVMSWLQGHVLNHITQRVVRGLRADAQAKLSRLPLAYFDGRPHGEIVSRVSNDIDNLATCLQQSLGQVLNAQLMLIGILVMMVAISPLLALVAVVTVPLSVVLAARIGRRAQRRFAAQWAHVGALNGHVEEAYTGHALDKLLDRRAVVDRRFAEINGELFRASFRAQFVSSMILPAITLVGNVTYVAIAVIGGLRVAAGHVLIGSVQAFVQYTRQFSQWLGALASASTMVQSGLASAERVFELVDADEQADDPAEPPPAVARVRGEICFEHVGFAYRADQPVIDDLSLAVAPGQTVAIVGPTGAGKTTVVNLLMRFYELARGRITIDGVDIARMPRGALRSQIAMVLQDTWLFAGTIRDNLRYARPAASDAEVIAAARATFVDRFVRAMPAGYDTVIEEHGGNLSAGERQLITIARAFLADRPILILDEATSSVDSRTELLIQRGMAALRSGRTGFVIAHRLSTIRDADVILVMQGGRIIERGRHHDLLAARGAYHALYQAAAIGDPS